MKNNKSWKGFSGTAEECVCECVCVRERESERVEGGLREREREGVR